MEEDLDDAELIFLRNQALKTARRKFNSSTGDATVSKLIQKEHGLNGQPNELVLLKESESTAQKNLTSIDKKENASATELMLRQHALKTLLQKRVVKTEELIKQNVAVAKQKVNEIRLHTKQSLKKEAEKDPVGAGEPKTLQSTTYEKTINEDSKTDFTNTATATTTTTNDPVCFFRKKISLGSDDGDAISLCASDEEERNSVSSEKSAIINKTDIMVELNSGNTIMDGPSSTIDTNTSLRYCSSLAGDVVQCNIVSCSDVSQEKSSSDPELSENLQEIYTQKQNDQTSEILLSKTNENLVLPVSESSDIVEECAGPSGYQQPKLQMSYDSDSSIELLSPPQRRPPLVIEVTDSDDGLETGTGKQKKKKKKRKKTLEDVLKESLSLTREDLKDQLCAICLGPFENRAFLDLYSFCYICIIQWSELSRSCPMCKTTYNALIHTVTKDLEYEKYDFPDDVKITGKKTRHQTQRRSFSETMEDGRRFRYRSTITDTETWSIRRAAREQTERERTRTREQRKIDRRLKWSATKDRRKAVYKMGMSVKDIKQQGTRKFRDISPTFFTKNPAMKHRLVPWLLRDLNVLLGSDDENIRFVMSLILNIIAKTAMEGEEFQKQLEPFLFDKTKHFIAELVSFARSPYDIRGYDDNVVYEIPKQNNKSSELTSGSKSSEPITIEEETDPFRDKLLREVFLANDDRDDTETYLKSPAEEESTTESLDLTEPTVEEREEDSSHVFHSAHTTTILPSTTERHSSSNGIHLDGDDPTMERSGSHNKESPTGVEVKNDVSSSSSSAERIDNDDHKKKKKRKRKKKRKKKEKRNKDEDDADDVGDDYSEDGGGSDVQKKKEKGLRSSQEELNRDSRKKHKKTRKHKHRRKRMKNERTCDSSDNDVDSHVYEADDRELKTDDLKETEKLYEKHDTIERDRSEKLEKERSEHEEKSKRSRALSVDNSSEKREDNITARKHRSRSPSNQVSSKRAKKRRTKPVSREQSPTRSDHETRNKRTRSLSAAETLTSDDESHRRKKKKKSSTKRKHKKTRKRKLKSKDETDKDDSLPPDSPNAERNENSSENDDNDENSAQAQLLKRFKKRRKSGLIKVGDSYKTHSEIVYELHTIEKALAARQEERQRRKAADDLKKTTKAVADSTVTENIEMTIDDAVDSAMDELQSREKIHLERIKRENTYRQLIKDLQDIEGRVDNCRSSLQEDLKK